MEMASRHGHRLRRQDQRVGIPIQQLLPCERQSDDSIMISSSIGLIWLRTSTSRGAGG